MSVEAGGEALIGRGIVVVGIDAVHDAAEPFAALLEQRREVPAVLRREHLAGVGGADGDHEAGVEDALGEGAIDGFGSDARWFLHERRRELVFAGECGVEGAGKREVVDGEDARQPRPWMPRLGGQTESEERRMRIVEVQEVRLPSEAARGGEQAIAEGEEARRIVVVAVDVLATERGFVLHEVHRHAADIGPPDRAARGERRDAL